MSLHTYDEVLKWDHHKLLEWLQCQEPITLEQDSEELEAFRSSKVPGSVFLQESTAFFRSCGVPLGVARRIELLGKQFRDNQKKRKAEFEEELQVKRYLPEARKQYTGIDFFDSFFWEPFFPCPQAKWYLLCGISTIKREG